MAAHTGTQFVQLAARYVGTPYVYGGSSPRGFDCSGLVYYVLGKLGISAPRTSEGQYAWTKRVSPQALRPGDLVFLNFPGENSPGHVMIWLGDDKVLQAPAPGQKVEVSHFDPQRPGSNEWGAEVVGYGRIPGLSYKGEPSSVQVAGGSTGGGFTGAVGGIAHDVASPFESAASTAGAVAGFFRHLLDPHFWLRALEVVGGFLLLLLGLYLLTRSAGIGGVPEPPTPGLSDETLADLQRTPGPRPQRTRRRMVRHEVGSDASDRRAAIRRRAALARPSDDIPF